MRMIDADALLDKCYHAYPSIDHYCTSRSVVDARDVINAPAVDAEPVVHGRWIKRYDGIFDCSSCGVRMDLAGTPEEYLMHYCPNCGAKMDGDVE